MEVYKNESLQKMGEGFGCSMLECLNMCELRCVLGMNASLHLYRYEAARLQNSSTKIYNYRSLSYKATLQKVKIIIFLKEDDTWHTISEIENHC